MENETSPYGSQTFGAQQPLPNATAILVLGIISIVGCFCYGVIGFICGIIALVLANKDLKLYNANPSAYTTGSHSNVKSGRTCAIIGVALSAFYVIAIIVTIITLGSDILFNPTHYFQK